MNGFRNLKIKSKLTLLVSLFLVVFVAFAGVAYTTLNSVKVHGPYYQEIVMGKDLVADILPPPEYVIETYLYTLLMADPANRREVPTYIKSINELRDDYSTRHQVWVDELPQATREDQNLRQAMVVDSYTPAMQFFNEINEQLIPAVNRGDYATARKLVNGPLRQSYNQHRDAINRVVKMANDRNTMVEEEATRLVKVRVGTMAALAGVIILFLLIGVGWGLNRSIADALQETASTLSSTSSQIASAIEEHERTAMHQSAAVHETTATMDELDASFRQTVEMVTTAADTARAAAAVAEDGIRTVQETRDGMLELKEKVGHIATQILNLSERTSQIGAITNLVSDLANQTNMLALNAAVEAARAGEHGKGFSVVASEIRKLADESKKSAERINTLVEDIQKATNSTVMATEEGTKNVDRGIRLAEQTVQAFNMVVHSSTSASEAAQQTLLSVPQQVTAVKQVLTSMESLTTGARETADGIGQTKYGVENLRSTAVKLSEMI
jgi:hypothetical protein